MSFVASATPAPAPSPAPLDRVEGDGWWADLSIAVFRDTARIGPSVTDRRVREALVGGMLTAMAALATWRVDQEAAGRAALELVPGPFVDGEARALILYRRAAHAYAAADLAETHSDIGATDAGRERRDVRAMSVDEHRRNALAAIRDLIGRPRNRALLV